MPDTRRQEKQWPSVDDWLLTTKYTPEELDFVVGHFGESPGVALAGEDVPPDLSEKTVEPLLQRLADLTVLGERGDPRYYEPNEIHSRMKQAIFAYTGYCAEREAQKLRTGMHVPHDSMFAYDDLGREIGYGGPGSDSQRVRAFDVPLLPQAEHEHRRLSQMWLDKARADNEGGMKVEDDEASTVDGMSTEQLRAEVEKETKAAASESDGGLVPAGFIQRENHFACPVINCAQTEMFKINPVSKQPHETSRRAALTRMLRHCKACKEYPDIHRALARNVERAGA